MRKRKLKKGLAWILACALFMGMTPVNTQAKEQKNSEIVLFNCKCGFRWKCDRRGSYDRAYG